MERKIGEIFEYNGEWYQTVKSQGKCCSCDFMIDGHCIVDFSSNGSCFYCHRKDKENIIFKKLEKIGGPYDDCGTILQRFKIYTNVTNADTKGLELHIYSNDTIGIEIKEHKENMKEKNLKPFDIEAAKVGKLVCTRNGRKARIICFDKNNLLPIVALVTGEDGLETVFQYYSNGQTHKYVEHPEDLMMLPKKKEGWVNVYYDNDAISHRSCRDIYDTKEEAEKKRSTVYYIATVKVEWEE